MAVTRTIYLATKEDLKNYNKAKKIGSENKSSASRVILDALADKLADLKKVPEIYHVLHTGKTGSFQKQSFKGVFITSEVIKDSHHLLEKHIFQTQKQNIVVYTRNIDLKDNFEKAELLVHNSLEAATDISKSLYRQAKEIIDISESEFLDI